MKIDILTIFPNMFEGFLKIRTEELMTMDLVEVREWY